MRILCEERSLAVLDPIVNPSRGAFRSFDAPIGVGINWVFIGHLDTQRSAPKDGI